MAVLVRTLIRFGARVLVSALFAGNAAVCAALTSAAAEEMACCKAGHLTCGKMTSASDCCKSQQRAAPTIAVAKHPDLAVVLALPASAPAPFAFVPTCRRSAPAAGLLKRPHDPPHLHTFSLLI